MKYPTLFEPWEGKGCRRLDGTQRQVLKSLGFDPNTLSTAREACVVLEIDEPTLRLLAVEYGMPRFIAKGHVRFHLDLILAWLRSNPDAWPIFCAARTTWWLRYKMLAANYKYSLQPTFIES